jgi:predicted TIM-barrel fold metal-dependent hydrolase
VVIIDADAHIDEGPDMWATYSPARDQELALYVTEDELGYSWLTFGGRRLYLLDGFEVGNWTRAGELRRHRREGLAIDEAYRLVNTPVHDRDPLERLAKMDDWGIDEAVLFPNRGFNWESFLAQDVEAVRVNCAAWNRWTAEVTEVAHGRLHPVGHVALDGGRSPWLEEQLRFLGSAGVRQVMVSPGLIGGIRPSDPSFDPVWELFVENGLALTWHVHTRMGSVFDRAQAWWSNDRDSHVQFMNVLFGSTAAQMTLVDFAVNGVFLRHPGLRVVTAELTTDWFLNLPPRVDGLYATWDGLTGRPLNAALERSPGEYMLEHTTVVCSFPTDVTPAVIEVMDRLPRTFVFATDHPHPEGLSGVDAYRSSLSAEVPLEHVSAFYGETVREVLYS